MGSLRLRARRAPNPPTSSSIEVPTDWQSRKHAPERAHQLLSAGNGKDVIFIALQDDFIVQESDDLCSIRQVAAQLLYRKFDRSPLHHSVPLGARFKQLLPYGCDLTLKSMQIRQREAGCLENTAGDIPSFLLQGAARTSQLDSHLPFIRKIAAAGKIADGLKPLEQRRQGTRFKKERFTQFSDGLVILSPKRHHHQILRISKPEFIKERIIDPIKGVRSRVEGKTEQVLFGKRYG